MVSPANANPPQPDSNRRDRSQNRGAAIGGETATSRFLDTFGFHLLIVLLGIAMAFM